MGSRASIEANELPPIESLRPSSNKKERRKKFLKKLNRIFNPFDTVRYDSDIEPDSRSLHTSFWTKLWDTFQVFDGGTSVLYTIEKDGKKYIAPYLFDIQTRLGIFDYVTLGLPRLIHFLHSKFVKNSLFLETKIKESKGAKKAGYVTAFIALLIPKSLIGIPHLLINGLVRHTFAAVATLAFAFPVLIAEIISKTVRYFKERKVANELSVSEPENNPEAAGLAENNSRQPIDQVQTQQVKLRQVLGKVSLHNILVREVPQTNPTTKKLTFLLNKKECHEYIAFGFFNKDSKEAVKLMTVNEDARLIFGESTKPRGRKG